MKTAHNDSAAKIHALLVAFAHRFAVDPLYNLGHADLWRRVIVARGREQMIAALSYVQSACENLQHLPNVPHNGITYWRLHQGAVFSALLLDHLLMNEAPERFERTMAIALETLIPFAAAQAETQMCVHCQSVVETTRNFGKPTNSEEASARAEWERQQAAATSNQFIAATHLRNAEAFEVLAGTRKAS